MGVIRLCQDWHANCLCMKCDLLIHRISTGHMVMVNTIILKLAIIVTDEQLEDKEMGKLMR